VSDLTIIYLTVSQMPQRWERFHMGHLLTAIEDRPMVVTSGKPMEITAANGKPRPDTKYLIQSGPFSKWNVYRQLLRGALEATTQYVAVAEDDTLYSRRHFSDFRPPEDAVAYDLSRWSVFSWSPKPFFSAIRRHGNFTMIGPRKLVIRALQEREVKYPKGKDYAGEIGRPDVERNLGLTPNKLQEWYCIHASVNLCHPQGLSPTYIGSGIGRERKPGELKAWDIPYWGKAADIACCLQSGR
jgi:hypothetical protein